MGSKGYAYRISSNKISMVVTEQGGRILSLKSEGHEVMWSNPYWFEKIPGILQKGREKATWDDVNTLGGGKIQIAPQDLHKGHVPFLDLHLGLFTSREIDGGVELTSPVCSESGFQVVEKISMTGSFTFEIKTYLVNHSKTEVKAAPWLVFQLPVSAMVMLPGLVDMPRAFKVFGDELPDDVLRAIGRNSFSLTLYPGGNMFKAGYNFSKEWDNIWPTMTVYFLTMNTSLKFEAENIEGPFPHGYRGETFGCDKYLEQEVLGKLQLLGPGQSSDTLDVKCTLAPIK